MLCMTRIMYFEISRVSFEGTLSKKDLIFQWSNLVWISDHFPEQFLKAHATWLVSSAVSCWSEAPLTKLTFRVLILPNNQKVFDWRFLLEDIWRIFLLEILQLPKLRKIDVSKQRGCGSSLPNCPIRTREISKYIILVMHSIRSLSEALL